MISLHNPLLFMSQSKSKIRRTDKALPANGTIRHLSGYFPERYALPLGYSAAPSSQQIFANNGKCNNLTIRTPFGQASWSGPIEISTLCHPLSQTFRMAHCEIEVYQQDCGSPSRGLELNRPCLVTFLTARPPNRNKLLMACKENGTQLVGVCSKTNSFTVLVPHFTKYNFNQDESTDKKAKSRETARNGHPPSNSIQQNILKPNGTVSDKSSSNIFMNFKMEVQKKHDSPLLTQVQSPESSPQQNPISSIMNAILQKQASNEANRVKLRVFENICNFIESDKVFYNKQIKSTALATKDQLLQIENRYRERLGCDILDEDEFQKTRMTHSLVGSGQVVTCKRFQCDFQPFVEVITLKKDYCGPTPITDKYSFYGLITNPSSFTPLDIARICTDQAYPLYVRRFLSLYSVLFQEEVYLSIGRDGKLEYSMRLLENPRDNTGLARVQFFKNWLAWVSSAELPQLMRKDGPFLHNSELNRALALRKPETAIDFLYVNNRWDDAQVLINIEDPAFRSYFASLGSYLLAPQLEDILSESVKKLSKGINDWFLLMAFSVWYLKKESFIENLYAVVEMVEDPSRVTHLQQEFRLIQLFLSKQGKPLQKSQLFTHENESLTSERLSCLYLTSNYLQLVRSEQAIITNAADYNLKCHLYALYRHQVVSRLAEMHSGTAEAELIVRSDGFISKAQKQSILKKYSRKVGTHGEERTEEEALDAANELVSVGKTIQGLALLFGVRKWSDQVYHRVCQLVTLPHLLVSYKRSVNDSLQALLVQRGDAFADLLLILAVGRRDRLSAQQSLRLVEILQGKSRFQRYLQPMVRSFLQTAFERIILQAIVLRNEFLEEVSTNDHVMNVIAEIFKEKAGIFKKMEEAVASL